MWLGRLTIVFLLVVSSSAWAQNNFAKALTKQLQNQKFSAKVIRIIDGDTMEVLFKNTPIKLRLAHIDCPELKKQPFGKQAKKNLARLCFNKIVTVHSEKTDRYGRLIVVISDDKNQIVNLQMIKLGMAWHFTKYSNNKVYAQLEQEARKHKIGLWQENNPTPPWQWRRPKSI